MESIDFMNGIYRGVLNQTVFDSYREPEHIETIEYILGRYEKLLEAYPPKDLEERGRIPDEMLKKMGSIGIFGLSITKVYGGGGADPAGPVENR